MYCAMLGPPEWEADTALCAHAKYFGEMYILPRTRLEASITAAAQGYEAHGRTGSIRATGNPRESGTATSVASASQPAGGLPEQ